MGRMKRERRGGRERQLCSAGGIGEYRLPLYRSPGMHVRACNQSALVLPPGNKTEQLAYYRRLRLRAPPVEAEHVHAIRHTHTSPFHTPHLDLVARQGRVFLGPRGRGYSSRFLCRFLAIAGRTSPGAPELVYDPVSAEGECFFYGRPQQLDHVLSWGNPYIYCQFP
jgi:hypothetical protein